MRERRSKYGAKVCYVDGIRFASKREAARYSELKLLEAAGEITRPLLQVPYFLHAASTRPPGHILIGKYVADFVYQDRDVVTHVEDAKGFRTPLYRWKRKHFEAEYGLRIEEV